MEPRRGRRDRVPVERDNTYPRDDRLDPAERLLFRTASLLNVLFEEQAPNPVLDGQLGRALCFSMLRDVWRTYHQDCTLRGLNPGHHAATWAWRRVEMEETGTGFGHRELVPDAIEWGVYPMRQGAPRQARAVRVGSEWRIEALIVSHRDEEEPGAAREVLVLHPEQLFRGRAGAAPYSLDNAPEYSVPLLPARARHGAGDAARAGVYRAHVTSANDEAEEDIQLAQDPPRTPERIPVRGGPVLPEGRGTRRRPLEVRDSDSERSGQENGSDGNQGRYRRRRF